MDKKVVTSPKAPRPVGPYSQAIEAGDFIFLSGQVGLDPQTNQLAPGGLAGQAAQALDNLTGVLQTMGLDLSAVVKMTVFLTDMADFPALNEVYAKYFSADPPARSCFAVKDLPLGAKVEMEAVAVKTR
ncbi:MAG: RidA family protein [Deltaproteobacteria bacterium]|nr:RidA family protein [Deltaproteobacteria bacterium]